ncbi:MAG: hypothetical protein P1V81_04420 [Planctomycetota bacterium]|nr:hypothetical protein [Planctomycetota bacterium]
MLALVARQDLDIHNALPPLAACIADILENERQGIPLAPGSDWNVAELSSESEHPIFRGSGDQTVLLIAEKDRFPLLFTLLERGKLVDPISNTTPEAKAMGMITPEERTQLVLIAQLADSLTP